MTTTSQASSPHSSFDRFPCVVYEFRLRLRCAQCYAPPLRGTRPMHPGGVAERSKAHAWKVCIRETVSRVRIPPPPPTQNRTANADRSRFYAAGGDQCSEQIALRSHDADFLVRD